ncbi:Hemolysin A [Mucinivorans hirudinis]|uniref:Hemolysin A n=1 Tax=Mucinivorans hirudinis TaxID=1433126 RepID=A0A060RAA2_9BACT|nr:Hemolysin A [Mucinivorans hirudinis]
MKRIEIKKLFEQKNPQLSRLIPGMVFGWLESLICARKINYILDSYSSKEPLDFIESTLKYVGVTYELRGTDNIPRDGRVIFAANHPLGGLDGLILAKGVSEHIQSNVKLIVNDLLMNLEPLQPLFVPINKHGSQSADYVRAQQHLYASDDAIITFPAGLCSRLINREIIDTEWKRNFINKASEYGRAIIPTYIEGRNSMFFYQLAKWRKRLKIKANIEMILLPREMFAQRGKHITITFGEPQYIDKEHTAFEWTEIIRKKVYSQKK